MEYVLGIDLGGTNVRFGVVDKNFALIEFEIFKTSDLLSDGIEKFVCYVNDYIENRKNYNIKLVSIGFPSTINKERTKIYSTPNIKNLQNINISDVFKKYCSVPVVIEKDVNLLLKHDINAYGISSEGVVIGFYIGTGLGNSILIDGKILKGNHGVAGELGHIPAFKNERKCACGNIGCVESIASGRYIVELLEDKSLDIDVADFFLCDELSNTVDEFLENLSMSIVTEINIFDPHHIIIGGGVVEMKGFPKEDFVDRILKRVRKPLPAEDLDIIFTKGKQASGVIGAGMYGFERLGDL